MAINKLRPTANADSNAVVLPSRTGEYLEAYVASLGVGRTWIADEGSYYTACNATLGTALTAHAAPAISDTDTKSIIHIFNPTTATASIYLDYIWMKQTVVNASSTAADYLVYIDQGNVTARASGGTAITPANTLTSKLSTASAITMYAGAVVTSATVATKVAQRTVRPVISVANDQYVFSFGSHMANPSANPLTGTLVANTVTSWPPVVIAPGGNFKFVQTGPSGASTAATFEFELGYWAR
jgi:hypothetical protein